jgi:hypothetical protein
VRNQADPLTELKLLVKSRYGLICIETPEERRVESILNHLADQLQLPLFVWTRARGLIREGEEQGIYNTQDSKGALNHIISSRMAAIYDLQGMGPDLENALVVELLKEGSRCLADKEGAILLTGTGLNIPEALRHHCVSLQLPPPRPDEYRGLLLQILRDFAKHSKVSVTLSKEDHRRLLDNLKGLTLMEAEKVLTKAIVVDNTLSAEDIRNVIDAKRQVVEREGLLEYYPVEATMQDIAALAGLKRWLAKRKKIIDKPDEARKFGLPFPKGVLLVGIPGTGKSLCAKAVAMEWGLPLLKMDPASLYNKYIGETEKNFKNAMKTAEKMAPVILWIDEIEKAFASASEGEESGVSTRVLGTFLGWLQDRAGDVFVVATANDVQSLPPELLRKGRFDEIFFVDLPEHKARHKLFEIHLKKRGKDPVDFDLDVLAEKTQGFSGADVEQVVVSALYTCFADSTPLDTLAIVSEIEATRPLSVTMPEKISKLRSWAAGRTVPAN